MFRNITREKHTTTTHSSSRRHRGRHLLFLSFHLRSSLGFLHYYTMAATTESSAANSASSQIPPCYSIDPSSVSRSRAVAINDDDPSPKDPFFPHSENNDKKPVWNKPCTSSSPPLMGPDSWPSLSLSSHKSPTLDSYKVLSDGSSPIPQVVLFHHCFQPTDWLYMIRSYFGIDQHLLSGLIFYFQPHLFACYHRA